VVRVLYSKRAQPAPHIRFSGWLCPNLKDYSAAPVLDTQHLYEFDIRAAAQDSAFLAHCEEITRRIAAMLGVSPQLIGDITDGGRNNIK
jgi:phage portal protein BeeE